MRQRFIQIPGTGELVPAEEYRPVRERSCMIMPDIKPYQSMRTGEMISSRSKHRGHLRQHGLIEVGNEIKAAMTHTPKKLDREQRKRHIAEALNNR